MSAAGTDQVRVVAQYESTTDANDAVELLQRHAIEGVQISLSGPGIEEANDPALEEPRQREALTRIAIGVGRGALAGVGIGVAVAVVLGALALVLDADRGLFVALVVWAPILGLVAGAMLAGMNALNLQPQWELTVVEVQDPVTVTVRGDDSIADRATEVLEGTHATRIERTRVR